MAIAVVTKYSKHMHMYYTCSCWNIYLDRHLRIYNSFLKDSWREVGHNDYNLISLHSACTQALPQQTNTKWYLYTSLGDALMLKSQLSDFYHRRRIVRDQQNFTPCILIYSFVLLIVANTDYVVATTHFITGQSMIQSLISDTYDYMPCGPLIDQFSTGSLQKYFKPPESQLNIQQKAYWNVL